MWESPRFADKHVGWKVYCVAVALALTTIYTVVLRSAFRPVHLLDLAMTLAGFAGLWGCAFRQRLLWARFWRVQAFLFPVWEILMAFVFSRTTGGSPGYVTLLALILFFVPEYWALWKYGYRSPDIWGIAASPISQA